MYSGTIKWFNIEKGYGYIIPDSGGGDVLVKSNSIVLQEGDKVSFEIEILDSGKALATGLTLNSHAGSHG